MAQFMTMEEAVGLVKDGDTIWINAFGGCASPTDLNRGLTKRFRETGSPKHLSVYSAFSFGDWTEGSDVEGYICEGAVDRVVIGHFASLKNTCRAIMNNEIEGYNLPGGVMSHMIRAAARGSKALFTKTGMNLFVDPELGSNYRLNEKSKAELVETTELGGEKGLLYKIPKVDIAFIKASFADERGNISFQNETASVDALSVAQATHRNGGKVIVQVVRRVNNNILPRSVNIPAALVDAVVICPKQQQITNMDGYFDFICGQYVPKGAIMTACRDEIRGAIGAVNKRNSLHTAIARRAMKEIQPGNIVNIGIGIPELVAEAVLESGMLEQVHLSVESGHTGGFPLGAQGFGVVIGPDSMMDMARQFDFYEGGGLDLCCVGALEIDGHGNVNGHYTKGKLSGIGGFANITQTTKRVVFCFTFTTGGIQGEFDGEKVTITKEGRISKFLPNVTSLSFSCKNALENKQEVLYVTERCVFRLGENGLILSEIAPGIDIEKDILQKLPFEVEIAKDLKLMEF